MSQCSKMLFRDYHSYPCSRSAKVERNGKGYCTQHDPVKVAEKIAERDAKWAEEVDKKIAESKARNEVWRWNKAATAFCAQVSAEELERLVAMGRPLHAILEQVKL